MQDVTLTVNKLLVYNEVAKTTAYTGAKQLTDEDQNAYERIFTKDDDRLMLERFFTEAANAITKSIRAYVVSVSLHPANNGLNDSDYCVTIEIADSWPDVLKETAEDAMFSCIVSYIIGNWYALQKKDEAATYIATAEAMKEEVASLIASRKNAVRRRPRPF